MEIVGRVIVFQGLNSSFSFILLGGWAGRVGDRLGLVCVFLGKRITMF